MQHTLSQAGLSNTHADVAQKTNTLFYLNVLAR